jgi:hypothetical protein
MNVFTSVPSLQNKYLLDDCPANNRFEIAALAKFQIEVVAVTSTD